MPPRRAASVGVHDNYRDAPTKKSAPRARLGRGRTPLRTLRAHIILILGIFLQTFVERMAHLHTPRANEVDALDGFVDALAVEDTALELFNPDSQQVLILALDL